MPNHSHLIKNATMNRYTRAANGVRAAVAKLDADLRRLERDSNLFDGEREQRKVQARAAAEAEVRKHRADMAEAVADHRSWANHTDDAPTGEEAARRSYYSTRAQAELAGMAPADALALVQRMASTGDKERAQEYAAAARGRVPAGALRSVERQVESTDAAGARHWGAAVAAIEAQLGWFDHHTATLMERVGYISVEAKAGIAPEEPLDLRVLDLWTTGLEGHAAQAFAASKASEGQWSGVAEALPTAGTEGYDGGGARDGHSAPQAPGEPQPSAEAPSDPRADQADAHIDARVQS